MSAFTKPDLDVVLSDLKGGASQADIARKHGYHWQAVHRLVKSVKENLGSLNEIELTRKDSFVLLHGISLGLQHDVLELLGNQLHLEMERVKDGVASSMNAGQLVNVLKSLSINQAVIFDKMRLEKGQSTSNMGLAGLVHHLHSTDGGLIDESTGDFKSSLTEARPHTLKQDSHNVLSSPDTQSNQ